MIGCNSGLVASIKTEFLNRNLSPEINIIVSTA